MIYNFDFLTHDVHDKIEEFHENAADNIDSIFDSECLDPFSDFEPDENHSILFGLNSDYPLDLLDIWNDEYVKLPCSKFNLNEQSQSVWLKVCSSLTQLKEDLKNLIDLSNFGPLLFNAVKEFNTSIRNFDNLGSLFTDCLDEKFSIEQIIKSVVPKMIDLALKLPDLIQTPIPILKAGKSHSISLNQEQCASLIANCFFCTFLDRSEERKCEKLPLFNFDQLFMKQDESLDILKKEKIKCILHYFSRITNKIESNKDTLSVITYSRIFSKNVSSDRFKISTKKIRIPIISNCSRIEDCKGALQLDFSCKFIGSGILSSGCVQEEIRFSICPELMVSMLFSECMSDNECIVIRGVERFSDYTGYGQNFRWNGDYVDPTDKDKFNRVLTDILAIDPLNFTDSLEQYKEDNFWREIKKCFIGYRIKSRFNLEEASLPRIATGNWGCGDYNGNIELKFLIQVIVASEVDRDLIYYTFENPETCRNLIRIIEIIKSNSLLVGEGYRILCQYCNKIQKFIHKQETPSSPTDQIKNFFKNVFNIKSNDSLVDYLEHHSKKN